MFPSGYLEGTIIFAAVGTLAVLSSVVGDWQTRRREARRADEMRSFAVNLGLDFAARAPEGFELPDVELLRRASYGTQALNFILPKAQGGTRLYFFDLKLVNRTGKGSLTYYVTAALAELDSERLPYFALRPESVLDKADQLLGTEEIDLDYAPGFSSKFVLTGPDPDALRAFFNPRRAALLENRPAALLQGSGRHLLIPAAYYGGREIKPADYPAFIEEARALVSELAP